MYIYFKNSNTLSLNTPKIDCGKVECIKLPLLHDLHSFVWGVLGGGVREYRLIIDKVVVSYARVVKKIFFFPFMESNGLHIGPCYTIKERRGEGFYPYLLNYIVKNNYGEDFYMIVDEKNFSSLKGVLKAGFIPFAKGHKTILNRYVIDEYVI